MTNNSIRIGSREIGGGHPAFIIAEIAQAHDGSLGMAHAYIDAAAEAGADAVKFQTHIADAESTRDEKFRIQMSGQDATRFDYWKRMEFTPDQWAALAKHAADKKVIFLSSAFSVPAVELLARLGMPAWKVGSGEFRSNELMSAMREAGGPILLSTGMSRYDEVQASVDKLRAEKTDFALFQCTSLYPTPLEKAGVNVIQEYREKFDCPVGLSDHTGTVHPSILAIARGADMIEVHITFDRGMYGPDVAASLTMKELSDVCSARDAFRRLDENPVNKDDIAAEMGEMRRLFTKSIALKDAASKGTVLSEEMMMPKKPGTGIAYADRQSLIGKKLIRDVPHDRLLSWEDFGEAGNA